MNVKEHLAGKRGICPTCGGRFDIPLADGTIVATATAPGSVQGGLAALAVDAGPAEMDLVEAESIPTLVQPAVIAPVASTLPDPIAEAPTMQWYIAPAGATTQYGPANAEMFRAWIAEGRVAADSMVWREGWPEWKIASSVLPQLQAVELPPHAPAPSAIPSRPSPWTSDTAPTAGGSSVSNASQSNATARPASPAVPLAPAKSRGVPTSIYIMIGIVAVLAGALIYVVILNRS